MVDAKMDVTTLIRVRADFPAWVITHDPGRPFWCRWVASRRSPLTQAEHRQHCRGEVTGPSLDVFLADLGGEQRAQDILAAVARG